MKSIQHLPQEEQQHFILCDCGNYIDMRNLAEVFIHLHASIIEPSWSHSIKAGNAIAYSKSGRKIDLN